jgi:hypothetical protein
MAAVFVMLGFFTGVSVASCLIVFALTGKRETAYWSLVKRHFVIAHLARLSIAALVLAGGVTFAYLGAMLA